MASSKTIHSLGANPSFSAAVKKTVGSGFDLETTFPSTIASNKCVIPRRSKIIGAFFEEEPNAIFIPFDLHDSRKGIAPGKASSAFISAANSKYHSFLISMSDCFSSADFSMFPFFKINSKDSALLTPFKCSLSSNENSTPTELANRFQA